MGAVLPAPDLAALLERTSRTFALAIPLLEGEAAAQVGVAYLLFRIADTLEDAPRWGRDVRARALASFARWLHASDEPSFRQLVREDPPTDDADCLDLLARADDVLATAAAMPAPVRSAILASTRRTALGMAEFVARQDERGGITLSDVDDLRRYAYVVAGIVGELLTELFAIASPHVGSVRGALDADAAAFGEGLQLVNILKDAPADHLEGRSYLPPGVARAAVFELARADLVRADRYVTTLRDAGAPPGIVAFCDLPVRLAVATLDGLARGTAKLGRDEVMRIYAEAIGRSRGLTD